MRFPLSEPPKRKPNWWLTAPGLASIAVLIIGALLIIGKLTSGGQ